MDSLCKSVENTLQDLKHNNNKVYATGIGNSGTANNSTRVEDNNSESHLMDMTTSINLNNIPKNGESELKSRSFDIKQIIQHQEKNSVTKEPSLEIAAKDDSQKWEALIGQTPYAAQVATLRNSYIQYDKEGKVHFYLFETQENSSTPFIYLLLVAFIDKERVVLIKENTLTLQQICEHNVRRTYFKLFRVSSKFRKRRSIMYREVGRHVLSEDILLSTPTDPEKLLIYEQIQAFRGIKNKDNILYFGKSDIIFDEKYHFVELHSFVFPMSRGQTNNSVPLASKPVQRSLKSPSTKSSMSWKIVVRMTGVELAQNEENKLEAVAEIEEATDEPEQGEEERADAANVAEGETEDEKAKRVDTIDNTVQVEPITPELKAELAKYHTSETFDVNYGLKVWIGEAFEQYSDWKPMNPERKKSLEKYLKEFAENQYELRIDFEILLERNIEDESILHRNIFHMVFGYHYENSENSDKYKTYFCALLHKNYKEMLDDEDPHDLVIALAIGQTSQDAISTGYELEMEHILKSSQVVGIAHIAHLQLAEEGKDWGILTPVLQNILQCGMEYRIFNFKITTNVGRIGYACVTYIYNEQLRCWVGGGVKIYKSGDRRSDDLKHWENVPGLPMMKNVNEDLSNGFARGDDWNDSHQGEDNDGGSSETGRSTSRDAEINQFKNSESFPSTPAHVRFQKPEPRNVLDLNSISELPEWRTFVGADSVEMVEVPIALETQGWITLTSQVAQEELHDKLIKCKCVVVPSENTTNGKLKYIVIKNDDEHTFIIGIVGRTYFFIHKFKQLILYYRPRIVGFTNALSSAENYISDYINWQEATPKVRKLAGGQIQAEQENVKYYAQINHQHFAIIQNGPSYYLVRQVQQDGNWGFESYCAETLLRFRRSCALYDLAWESYTTRSRIDWVTNSNLELGKQQAHQHPAKRSLFARLLTGVSDWIDEQICLRVYKWFANVLGMEERLQMLAVILAAKHQMQVRIVGFGVYNEYKPYNAQKDPESEKTGTASVAAEKVDKFVEEEGNKIPPVSTKFKPNLRQQFVIVKLLPFKSLIENTDDPKCNRFQAISVINFLDQDLNFSLGSFWSSIYPRYTLAGDEAEHGNRLNKC